MIIFFVSVCLGEYVTSGGLWVVVVFKEDIYLYIYIYIYRCLM